LSTSTGGALYYSALKEAAIDEAHRQAVTKIQTVENYISSYLSEYQKWVRALSGLKEMQPVLMMPGEETGILLLVVGYWIYSDSGF
jgi:hypothetical protein